MITLTYDLVKDLSLEMVKAFRSIGFEPDEVVAISRGGLTPATIFAKEFNVPCGVFFPQTRSLHLVSTNPKRILFVEDLIAKGRTFDLIRKVMTTYSGIEWDFAPILVDADYEYDGVYGIKTKHWCVFPWEKIENVKEGDWGLFREGTAKYGD